MELALLNTLLAALAALVVTSGVVIYFFKQIG